MGMLIGFFKYFYVLLFSVWILGLGMIGFKTMYELLKEVFFNDNSKTRS